MPHWPPTTIDDEQAKHQCQDDHQKGPFVWCALEHVQAVRSLPVYLRRVAAREREPSPRGVLPLRVRLDGALDDLSPGVCRNPALDLVDYPKRYFRHSRPKSVLSLFVLLVFLSISYDLTYKFVLLHVIDLVSCKTGTYSIYRASF